MPSPVSTRIHGLTYMTTTRENPSGRTPGLFIYDSSDLKSFEYLTCDLVEEVLVLERLGKVGKPN